MFFGGRWFFEKIALINYNFLVTLLSTQIQFYEKPIFFSFYYWVNGFTYDRPGLFPGSLQQQFGFN
jgi:hypothetical protein